MKHSQKAKMIFLAGILLVGLFSVYILFRSLHPSGKLPYEQLEMSKAVTYMEYEKDYVLVDAGKVEDYAAYHIPGAISLPLDTLAKTAPTALTEKEQLIYVCAADTETSRKAALALCSLGYANVTEIGSSSGYEEALRLLKEQETQGILENIFKTDEP